MPGWSGPPAHPDEPSSALDDTTVDGRHSGQPPRARPSLRSGSRPRSAVLGPPLARRRRHTPGKRTSVGASRSPDTAPVSHQAAPSCPRRSWSSPPGSKGRSYRRVSALSQPAADASATRHGWLAASPCALSALPGHASRFRLHLEQSPARCPQTPVAAGPPAIAPTGGQTADVSAAAASVVVALLVPTVRRVPPSAHRDELLARVELQHGRSQQRAQRVTIGRQVWRIVANHTTNPTQRPSVWESSLWPEHASNPDRQIMRQTPQVIASSLRPSAQATERNSAAAASTPGPDHSCPRPTPSDGPPVWPGKLSPPQKTDLPIATPMPAPPMNARPCENQPDGSRPPPVPQPGC